MSKSSWVYTLLPRIIDTIVFCLLNVHVIRCKSQNFSKNRKFKSAIDRNLIFLYKRSECDGKLDNAPFVNTACCERSQSLAAVFSTRRSPKNNLTPMFRQHTEQAPEMWVIAGRCRNAFNHGWERYTLLILFRFEE